ncbi:hypothetical protein [Thermophilibacter sp.]
MVEEQVEASVADAASDEFDVDEIQPDLDTFDFCFALAVGLVGILASTNEEIEGWLARVHDSASGKPGDYDVVQRMLGALLYHKGDALDVYSPGEGFVGRNGERAYVMFHRLLFGHDVLAFGKGIMPHNPFALMYEQRGLMGILQAVRHLVADTMSLQGLPMPGSSLLDTERENGKPWNRIIDWVQELSVESCGDKRWAQEIYSHMFTIRAQDIASGGLIPVLNKAYFAARSIEDPVRRAQIRLIDTGLAFFGQAAVGAARQRGIPYINVAMVPQLAKAYGDLIVASSRRTRELQSRTDALCASADEQIARHALISDMLSASRASGDTRVLSHKPIELEER